MERSPTLQMLLDAFREVREAERSLRLNRDSALAPALAEALQAASDRYEALIALWDALNPPPRPSRDRDDLP